MTNELLDDVELGPVPPDEATQDEAPLPPTLFERWRDGVLASIIDNRKPLLRMADAGLGTWLDDSLGGGLAEGETLAVGASGAGAGKTALVHQAADGWAKWSAWQQDDAAGSGRRASVVPVLYVTEMGTRALSIRTLARECGVPGKYLRAPGHFGERGEEAVRRVLTQSGRLQGMSRFVTALDRAQRIGAGTAAVRQLGAHLNRIRDGWQATADVRTAVLVVDPLHRLLPPGVDETRGLGDVLGDLLEITQANGFVTILTSDTTKAAAATKNGTGDEDKARNLEAEAEQAFRGSYQLLHFPDHVVAVRGLDPVKHAAEIDGSPVGPAFRAGRGEERPEWATTFAHLPSPKLRWGKVGDLPAYWYDRALFRFVPIARPADRPQATVETAAPRATGVDLLERNRRRDR